MSPRNKEELEGDGQLEVVTEKKTKKPRLFKVLLHNDHYTTMEFVVAVLKEIFYKSDSDATTIMLHIHRNGVGVAGVYSREIAETKAQKSMAMAKEAEYPLLVTVEPE